MRWHGTTIGSGLVPSAVPAARWARGLPGARGRSRRTSSPRRRGAGRWRQHLAVEAPGHERPVEREVELRGAFPRRIRESSRRARSSLPGASTTRGEISAARRSTKSSSEWFGSPTETIPRRVVATDVVPIGVSRVAKATSASPLAAADSAKRRASSAELSQPRRRPLGAALRSSHLSSSAPPLKFFAAASSALRGRFAEQPPRTCPSPSRSRDSEGRPQIEGRPPRAGDPAGLRPPTTTRESNRRGGGAATSGRSSPFGVGLRRVARWWSMALFLAIVITHARGLAPSRLS